MSTLQAAMTAIASKHRCSCAFAFIGQLNAALAEHLKGLMVLNPGCLQSSETELPALQVTDASKAEVARRERERLRLQAKQKKDQLEKLRDQQNDDTATGEVSCPQMQSCSCFVWSQFPAVGGHHSTSRLRCNHDAFVCAG